MGEFKRLGDVAGVSGSYGKAGGGGGGEHFNHEDPTSVGALIETLRANEQRNESALTYAQSLDQEHTGLTTELEELVAEEAQLIARAAAAEEASAAAKDQSERMSTEGRLHALRFDELQTKLTVLRPQLSTVVARLADLAAPTAADARPAGAAGSGSGLPDLLAPLPARSLPEGLVQLPIDKMPLHEGLEVRRRTPHTDTRRNPPTL